jgi:hypothetical protein
VYERLDSESPNRSPSMAKRVPWCKLEPAKPGDRESRQKKTSSQASVPEGLACNTSNALEALRFTVRFKIFDRCGLPPINRRGPTPLHVHCHFQPRFSLVIFRLLLLPLRPASRPPRKPWSTQEVSFLLGLDVCSHFLVIGVTCLNPAF